MTKVLVVAPSAVIRAGLESIINASPGLEATSVTGGTTSLAEQVEAVRPDVVLMELESSETGPSPRLPMLESDNATAAMVLLTPNAEGSTAVEALRRGIRGVLPRGSQPEEIVAAVEAAAAGLAVLPEDALEQLLPAAAAFPSVAHEGRHEELTSRETEVLGMLAEGAGNKQIARRLGISEHTVKFHVGSIMAKLNASSRTEAVTLGIRQGLIML